DAVEKLGRPRWLTVHQLVQALPEANLQAHIDGKRFGPRGLARELDKCGYEKLSGGDKVGRFTFSNGGRAVVYRRKDVPPREIKDELSGTIGHKPANCA